MTLQHTKQYSLGTKDTLQQIDHFLYPWPGQNFPFCIVQNDIWHKEGQRPEELTGLANWRRKRRATKGEQSPLYKSGSYISGLPHTTHSTRSEHRYEHTTNCAQRLHIYQLRATEPCCLWHVHIFTQIDPSYAFWSVHRGHEAVLSSLAHF